MSKRLMSRLPLLKGAPPIATKLIIGTTTTAFVDSGCIIADTKGVTAACAGAGGLMATGSITSATAATSSTVFLQKDYTGVGVTNWELLEPGSYLVGYATSTMTEAGVQQVT